MIMKQNLRTALIGFIAATVLPVSAQTLTATDFTVKNLRTETESGMTSKAKVAEETEFGKHLLKTMKEAGVKINMPDEKVKRLKQGAPPQGVQPEVTLPENMRFTGFLNYSYVDGEMWLPYGHYTFSQKDGLQRKALPNPGALLNYSGVYIGNHLKGSGNIEIPQAVNSAYSTRTYDWDTDTWINVTPPLKNRTALTMVGMDLDPVSGKIYGINMMGSGLFEIDFENATSQNVADMPYYMNGASAFAISNDGIGYIIDDDGQLAKVDLKTMEFDQIGYMDFNYLDMLQSMTFDRKTNKLYLAVSEYDEDFYLYGRLCEVNLNDANTKLVGYFPEDEEYTVLHVVYDPEAGAPGKITDLTATYNNTTLEGTLSFTMPEVTFGGRTLTGDVEYSIYINDSEIPVATGKKAAGSRVETVVTPELGRTKYVVILKNDAGEGERNAIESWGGEDFPAVADATITSNGSEVKVSWNLTGVSGGFVKPEGVTYKIVRQPDRMVLAENTSQLSITDKLEELPFAGYSYQITPLKGGESFKMVETEKVFAGVARELPYIQDFNTNSAKYDFYTINHHNGSWKVEPDWDGGGVLWYNASPYLDADDWAISPKLHMEKDMAYYIRFDVFKMGNHDEILEVGIGSGLNPENYETLMQPTVINNTYYDGAEHKELMYICRETGDYNVGFHALSQKNTSVIMIDGIEVTFNNIIYAPEAPNDVTVTPGAKGELTATITFTAPSNNIIGDQLSSLNKAVLYRNNIEQPVSELSGIEPGKTYQIIDDEAVNGQAIYSVAVCNEFGEGNKTSATGYVGFDIPVKPNTITVKDNLDGTFSLTWQQSDTGINGGPVDLNDLTYNVYYYEMGEMVPLGKDIEDMQFTTKKIASDEQILFGFYVTAENELGESEYAESPSVIIGEAYSIPFVEGFKLNNLESIWVVEGNEIEWYLGSGTSFDGDDNVMLAESWGYGETGSIISGKLSLKGAASPKAIFSVAAQGGANNIVTLYAYANGESSNRKKIAEVDFSNIPEGFNWVSAIASLDNFKDSDYINLVFTMFTDDAYNYRILLDDVEVRDVCDHNLEIAVEAPNRGIGGDKAPFAITVHNIGMNPENDYSVEFYADDTLVTTLKGETINQFDRQKFVYDFIPSVADIENNIEIRIVSATDMEEKDNSYNCKLEVTQSLLNPAENLTLEDGEGSCILSWEKPSEDTTVTDSFESYTSFLYDGFGEWTVFDGDKSMPTPLVTSSYPGMYDPSSFFTVDFTSLGYDLSERPEFLGHTGSSYIACMPNANYKSNDWVISPKLSGKSQEISLFIQQYGAYMGQKINIYYSTSGNSIEDFKALESAGRNVGDEYQLMTFTLPEGALYFALNNNTEYGGMLMIDDVTFEGAPKHLTGYNIYRNGKLLAKVEADKTTYTDGKSTSIDTYFVTALYEEGESRPSNMVANTSSVESLESEETTVRYSDGMVFISTLNGEDVKIMTVDGIVLYSGCPNGEFSFSIGSGVHIITVGNRIYKAIGK